MKTIRIDECEICTIEKRYNREEGKYYKHELKNGEMMNIYLDTHGKYFEVIGVDYDPYDEDDKRCTVVNVTFNEDRSEGFMNIGIEEDDEYQWKTLYIKALSGKINTTRIYEVIVVDFSS